jgi:hypothetical protein
MEDLWKKFKEETKEHIQKINEFLNETSSGEKSHPSETVEIKDETSDMKQIQQIVLDNETSDNSRKNIYGKLKDTVKEIMEREHVSRAQAYRKAKKEFSTIKNKPL